MNIYFEREKKILDYYKIWKRHASLTHHINLSYIEYIAYLEHKMRNNSQVCTIQVCSIM